MVWQVTQLWKSAKLSRLFQLFRVACTVACMKNERDITNLKPQQCKAIFFLPTCVNLLFAVGLPRIYFYLPWHFCLESIYFQTTLNILLLFPWKRGKRRQGVQTLQEKREELYKQKETIVMGTENIALYFAWSEKV